MSADSTAVWLGWQAVLLVTRVVMYGLPLGSEALLLGGAVGVGAALGFSAPHATFPSRATELVVPQALVSSPPVMAPTPSAIAAEAALCRAGGGELYAGSRQDEFVCTPTR